MSDTCDNETGHEWQPLGVWTIAEFSQPKAVFGCLECGAWTTWELDNDDHVSIDETEVLHS